MSEEKELKPVLLAPETAARALAVGLRTEPGWHEGVFTRERAVGALPNGIRVKKANSEESDMTKDGEEGVILGSIGFPRIGYGYFIEWDERPKHAVFTVAKKLVPLEPVEDENARKVH
jgi:hypothetical protein